MTYFNTTNESGASLKNKVAKAKSQEGIILKMFEIDFKYWKDLAGYVGMSPTDLLDYFPKYPITSIRRALTNLTKQGKLIKTNEKRIGMYGRSEYVWKLNEKQTVCNYCLEWVDELPDKFGCKKCIEKHK